MNKIRLALAAVVLTVTTATSALAQAPLKIGYTSVSYVLAQMPESKQIESQLGTYSSQLQAQMKSKYDEYGTKRDALEKGGPTMTDVVRNDKIKELQTLEQSIQEFQRNAEQNLQQKQQALLKPALDKLQKAIDDVAKEQGYTYVLNSDGDSPVLLHGPEDGNISDMVLKKMGITPPAPGAAPAASAAPAPAAPKAAATPATSGKKKK